MNGWETAGGPIAAGALGMVFVVGWLVMGVVLSVLVGRDAVRTQVPAPWAWCLAALFQPVGVALVYLFMREPLRGPPHDQPQNSEIASA